MTKVTIELQDNEFNRLEKAANRNGKSIKEMIKQLIFQLPDGEKQLDVTEDPIYQMGGYDSDAPSDLSKNLDKYLYGQDSPQ